MRRSVGEVELASEDADGPNFRVILRKDNSGKQTVTFAPPLEYHLDLSIQAAQKIISAHCENYS